jgi:cyclopropane fatty-acyl-phospholipid synthase-like methyltransferase
MDYIRPGLICEMGCGSGAVLEFLSGQLPGSTVIGVDRSLERLQTAASGAPKDVLHVAAEIPGRVLAEGRFDSVVFVWSMHEVYSQVGDRGMLKTLKAVRDMLKDEGTLVIQDFLRPAPRQVNLGFKNEDIRDRFRRFAREFRPRTVDYTDLCGAVRLDVGDAVEFISKYQCDDEEHWRHEMSETHFFQTLEQLTAKAGEAGFTIERVEGSRLSWETVDAAKHEMDFDFDRDFSWVQLALKKGGAK